MLKILRIAQLCLFSILLSLPLSAMADELDIDQLMKTLEEQLQISQEKYEQLKPEFKSALEAKSRELSTSLDSALDQSLAGLEKMGEEYEAASKASSAKFQAFLQGDEARQFKEFLHGLDEQAISEARDKMIADFIEVLQLTADQVEAIKPLLREKLEQLGAILNRYLNESKNDYEQFRVEFEAESRKGLEKFKAILDPGQEEKLEQQLDSIKESIRADVFDV